MKFLIVLAAVVAVALSGAVTPFGYNGLNFGYGYSAPAFGYSNLGYSNLGYANYGYGYAAAPIAQTYAAAPIAHSYAAAPIAYAAAPVAVAAPITTGFKSQYHAQDELGQASYGHSEPLQTHNAVQDVHGNKIGSYSYVAPTGEVFRTDYVADAAGFRVASNALPVGPTALPVGPAQIHDTPEVVAARAAHLAEFEAIKHRTKRGLIAAIGQLPASTAPLAAPIAYSAYNPIAYSAYNPIAYSAYNPIAYSAYNPIAHSAYNPIAYSAPIAHAAPLAIAAPVATPIAYSAVAAPAVREATLTTIVNNPGHAVSYRVDK